MQSCSDLVEKVAELEDAMKCDCGQETVSASSDRVAFYCGTVKTLTGLTWAVRWGTTCQFGVTLENHSECKVEVGRGLIVQEPDNPARKTTTFFLQEMPIKTPYETAVEIMEEFFPRLSNGPGIRTEMRDRVFKALIESANRELTKRRSAETELEQLKQYVSSLGQETL